MRLHTGILLLFCGLTLQTWGQSTSSIEKMRKERAEMEAQIAEQEKQTRAHKHWYFRVWKPGR